VRRGESLQGEGAGHGLRGAAVRTADRKRQQGAQLGRDPLGLITMPGAQDLTLAPASVAHSRSASHRPPATPRDRPLHSTASRKTSVSCNRPPALFAVAFIAPPLTSGSSELASVTRGRGHRDDQQVRSPGGGPRPRPSARPHVLLRGQTGPCRGNTRRLLERVCHWASSAVISAVGEVAKRCGSTPLGLTASRFLAHPHRRALRPAIGEPRSPVEYLASVGGISESIGQLLGTAGQGARPTKTDG